MADFENFQNLNQKLSDMVPATAQSTLAGLLDVYNTIVSKLVTVADSYARSYVTVQRLGTDNSGNVVDNTTANGQHIANQQIVRYQCDIKSLKERKEQLEEVLRDTLQFSIPSTIDMSLFRIIGLNKADDQLTFSTFTDPDENEITEVTTQPAGSFGIIPFIQPADNGQVARTFANVLYCIVKESSDTKSFVGIASSSNQFGGYSKVDTNINHVLFARDEDGKLYYNNFTNTKSWWPKAAGSLPVIKATYINNKLDTSQIYVDGTLMPMTEFSVAQYSSIENDFPAPIAHGDADLSPVVVANVAINAAPSNMDIGNTCQMFINASGSQTGNMHGPIQTSNFLNSMASEHTFARDLQTGQIIDIFATLEPGLKPSGLEDAMNALLIIDAT